jgi:predicted SAM-dependent methyltransferase
MKEQPVRLDIGAGSTIEDGWSSWDIKDGRDCRDLSALADESVDEIRACHVLEHISYFQTEAALVEWNRVLKPNGRLFVAVPDFAKIVAAMLSGLEDDQLERYLMGGQIDDDDTHRAIFTAAKLKAHLESAGFDRARVVRAEGLNASRHWVSLNVEAYREA